MPLIAVSFWLFLAVVSVAGIIQDYRKRQLALEPLRLAIERGQQLSPEVISRLLGQEERQDPIDPRYLDIGGIITCSAGVGIAILAMFLAMAGIPRYLVVLGSGLLVICVGVGLMIAARALRRYPA